MCWRVVSRQTAACSTGKDIAIEGLVFIAILYLFFGPWGAVVGLLIWIMPTIRPVSEEEAGLRPLEEIIDSWVDCDGEAHSLNEE